MARISVRALIALLPCAGCASIATQVNGSRSVVPFGDITPSTSRRVFTSHLLGDKAREAAATAQTSEDGCWGTVKLTVNDDDTFEYLITIFNPVGETFTGAQLLRRSPNASGTSVATLFSEVSLGNRYVQLRGTISVNRDRSAATLAEEIRERPGDFLVSVSTRAIPHGAMTGPVE
ncbi:MAG: CHRD domain-containing protein [Gemmatimonadaceae bacterium]